MGRSLGIGLLLLLGAVVGNVSLHLYEDHQLIHQFAADLGRLQVRPDGLVQVPVVQPTTATTLPTNG